MATIADELRKTKSQAIHNDLKEKADLLRFYVKSTLLEALQEAVKRGDDYAPVLAPEAIRHLFEQNDSPWQKWDMDSESSAYREVWDELKGWADSEGLYIGYGGTPPYSKEEGPSSQWAWQAYLGLKTLPTLKEVVESEPKGSTLTTAQFAAMGTAVIILIFVLVSPFIK